MSEPAPPQFTTLRAAELDTPSAYRLVIGCVVPRPIAWVTSCDANGLVNAAPFSSYNYVAHSPPMLAINIGSRNGALKDSARNITQGGEFVVNVATESDLDVVHACSADDPPDISEIDRLGIATLPSTLVRPPRIATSPIQMECRLSQIVPLGRGLNTLYIADIVVFHLSADIFDGRRIDVEKMRPLARLAGPYYAGIGPLIHRPRLQTPPGGLA